MTKVTYINNYEILSVWDICISVRLALQRNNILESESSAFYFMLEHPRLVIDLKAVGLLNLGVKVTVRHKRDSSLRFHFFQENLVVLLSSFNHHTAVTSEHRIEGS